MQTLEELLHAKPGELDSWNGMKIYAIDAKSGKELLNVGANRSHDPASLTKLMTFYLACRAITQGNLSTDESIRITKRGDNSTELVTQQSYSVHTLMDAMMTASTNNATRAIAATIGERLNVDIVDHMNSEAKRIGMTKTDFKNTDGWPIKNGEGNRSTPHDMAVLMQRIQLDYPLLAKEYMGNRGVTYNGVYHAAHQLLNNPASGLALMPSFTVLAKTGYVDASRHNIDSYITFPDGRPMIMVIMGSGNQSPQFARTLNVPESIIRSEVRKSSHPGLVGGNRIRDALVRELVDQLVLTWQPALVVKTPDPFAELRKPITAVQDGTLNRDPQFIHALKQAELHAIKQAGIILRTAETDKAPPTLAKPKTVGHER